MTQDSNNSFFRVVFKNVDGVNISKDWNPVICLTYGGETYKIHCPPPSSYVVNLDVVDQALDLGVDILAYSEDWQIVLEGAREYAEKIGLTLFEYKQVIGRVKNGTKLK